MSNSNNNSHDIKVWLRPILEKENLQEWTVSVEGNSSKGDGYSCDIVFVNVKGRTLDKEQKEYNLALKCSKRSESLTTKHIMQEMVENELYMYDKVFTAFRALETDRNIEDPLQSLPTFYGTYVDDKVQVLILENLKKSGFELWDQKLPWRRENLILNVREYGKLHALSVALQDQKPELLEELVSGLKDVVAKLFAAGGAKNTVQNVIEETYQLLQGELNQADLEKWRSLKDKMFSKPPPFNGDGIKVILHGDCWNNNFMLKLNKDRTASKIVKLDFQMPRFTSPIVDLAYFVFACTSYDDLQDIKSIIDEYYDAFACYLRLLGSDPNKLYSKEEFLKDWKMRSNSGAFACLIPLKMAYVDKDDLPDLATAGEKETIGGAFEVQISDKISFRNRVKGLVQYVAQNM